MDEDSQTIEAASYDVIEGSDGDLPDTILPLPLAPWPEPGYKIMPNALRGAAFGGIAACTSLLANIIGSLGWAVANDHTQHPLRIIQVYLTFPLGESALLVDTGVLLAIACILYLFTGILYGTLFEIVLSYFLPQANIWARFAVCSVLALCVWVINFYAVLSWLQPLLFGGQWILTLVPWWVAAITHLIFGWTIALLYGTPSTRQFSTRVM